MEGAGEKGEKKKGGAAAGAGELLEQPSLQPLSLLLTLQCLLRADLSVEPLAREVFVGCVRTMAVSQKKVCTSP